MRCGWGHQASYKRFYRWYSRNPFLHCLLSTKKKQDPEGENGRLGVEFGV